MLPTDVLTQIRRIHLRARKLVANVLGGEYHSAFKGSGLAFEDVREYQPGDDVRGIDWNVTARMGHPFIKRYVEERELTLILAVDVSASLRFGTQGRTKRVAAAELAALLALCASANNDRVGLFAFSDRVERFLRPNKGPRHVLRLLRDVLAFEPQHPGTNLRAALHALNNLQRRRAIVFLFSDFHDLAEDALRRTARKHDLIAVRITDPREEHWPNVGLLHLQDAEEARPLFVDTACSTFREQFALRAQQRRQGFLQLARQAGVDVIEVDTTGGHFDALLRFLRLRERRREHG